MRDHLHDPVLASVDPASAWVTTMEHHVLTIHPADKYATATEIAARDGRVLMFLDTKAGVDRFTRHLRAAGVTAAALHSGKSQPQRTHTLARFVEGEVTVLVATQHRSAGPSTSRRSTSSSTSIRRPTPRTTCTAAGVPRGPDGPGAWSRSSRPTSGARSTG
ncbi:ATP-dependent RNA helicase RhlE [Streptomyces violaceorubidus]